MSADGDRAEQLALFADARGEGELNLLELLRERLRRVAALVLRGLEARALGSMRFRLPGVAS